MEYEGIVDYVQKAGNNRNAAILSSLLESEPGMKELPDLPLEDGTYNLQVTVADGVSTVNWGTGVSSGSSSGGALYFEVTDEPLENNRHKYVLNKTYQEIEDAFLSGKVIMEKKTYIEGEGNTFNEINLIEGIGQEIFEEEVHYFVASGNFNYGCTSKSDYPFFIDILQL